MDRDSQEKLAFTTNASLYEFTVMPFGLCNAPATFLRLMEGVLSGLARDKCLIYLDDVLVVGRTFTEHIRNLREVLTRLSRAGLKLKPAKCKLVQQHSSGTLFPADSQKVRVVTEFPTPADLKSLRSFLGLTSYYRRLVPCFSSVAQPLYGLTLKDVPFVWTSDCEATFTRLKTVLMQAPVLAYPQFGRDFLLKTDASGVRLGAVLSQKQDDGTIRPIAFASRTLQRHGKNYSISELEGLGVVWAVKHFRHYIYSHRCTVFTDHEVLKALLNTPQPSGKLARWGMALQELDLKIEYRPGKNNARANALSRCPISLLPDECSKTQVLPLIAAVGILSMPPQSGENTEDSLSGRQRQDSQIVEIMKYIETGQLPQEDKQVRELLLSQSQFTVLEGVLYRVNVDKTLRIVPPTIDRHKLFLEVHEGPFS